MPQRAIVLAMSLLLLASVNSVTAVPTIEVIRSGGIPEPSLFSPAKLCLTSADSHAVTPSPGALETIEQSLQPRSACQKYTTGDVDNVISCFNSLQSKAQEDCTVNGDNMQFCSFGDAQVTGSNISGGPSISARCGDVALGLQQIFTYCNVGGRVGGSAAANDNALLIVGVENINW